jgi:hypothetical protein
MKISLMDRGLYFRGLMLLLRQDREVSQGERDLMMRLGRAFSFAREFCQGAIDEILTNPYMMGKPPLFLDPAVARSFLRDGLRLAWMDGAIHPRERRWLRAAAVRNGLDWSAYETACQTAPDPVGTCLEAEGFEWD